MPSEPVQVQETLGNMLRSMQLKAPSEWLKPCSDCRHCGLHAAATYLQSLSIKMHFTATPSGWSVDQRACERLAAGGAQNAKSPHVGEEGEFPQGFLAKVGIRVPNPGRLADDRQSAAQFCYEEGVNFVLCCDQMRKLLAANNVEPSIAMVEIETAPQIGLHLWRGGENVAGNVVLMLHWDL